MLCLWTKKIDNMRNIYSWYVSGGTVQIDIREYADSVSVTHIDL